MTALQRTIKFYSGERYVPSGQGLWITLEQKIKDLGLLAQEFVYWYVYSSSGAEGDLSTLNRINAMLSKVTSKECEDWAKEKDSICETNVRCQLYRVAVLRNCGLHLRAILNDPIESLSHVVRLELALEYPQDMNTDELFDRHLAGAVQFLIGQPAYLKLLPYLSTYLKEKQIQVML